MPVGGQEIHVVVSRSRQISLGAIGSDPTPSTMENSASLVPPGEVSFQGSNRARRRKIKTKENYGAARAYAYPSFVHSVKGRKEPIAITQASPMAEARTAPTKNQPLYDTAAILYDGEPRIGLDERDDMSCDRFNAPNSDAAKRLQVAMVALEKAIACFETSDNNFQPLVKRLSAAKKIVVETQELVSSPGIPPVGAPQERKVCAEMKTSKGKSRQAEAVSFIIRRYIEKGSVLPVSSTEILNGTSLRSSSNINLVLSELIKNGTLRTVRTIGVGGYVPTAALITQYELGAG